jgi:glycosyltransferase involved in cell wall biosynthesis
MNILFITTKFPPRVGGMEQSNFEIVKALENLDHKVVVLTGNNKKKELYKFDKSQNFELIRIKNTYPENYDNPMHRIKGYFSFYKKILFLKKNNEFSKVIIADAEMRKMIGFFSFLPLLELNLSQLISIISVPQIKTGKKNIFIKKIKNYLLNKSYSKTDVLVFSSNSTKNEIYSFYGENFFSEKKVYILHRTINNYFLNSPPNNKKIQDIKNKYKIENSNIILSISRITKEKGIQNSIIALKELLENDKISKSFKYLIVGEGKYLDDIKKLVKKNNMVENVVFCGNIRHENIISFYDVCDFFILPSQRESFGRVFAEAGSRKKAVIAPKVGGVPEVVLDKKTGLLINPNDINEIKNSILYLLNNSSITEKMGENGYKRINSIFNFNALCNNIDYILEGENCCCE